MTSTLGQHLAQDGELRSIRLGYTPEYVEHLTDFVQRANRQLCQQHAEFMPLTPDRDPLKLAMQVNEVTRELLYASLDGPVIGGA